MKKKTFKELKTEIDFSNRTLALLLGVRVDTINSYCSRPDYHVPERRMERMKEILKKVKEI